MELQKNSVAVCHAVARPNIRACPRNCVNGHNAAEISKGKRWPRHDKKRKRTYWTKLLDSIGFRGLTQDEVVGKNGPIKQLTGRILQRALEAEMTGHLGHEKNSNSGDNSGNSRNGRGEKTALLENQSATICVPRDRARTFEPIIAPKHEKRVPLFDDQVISTHGRGTTDREIRGHLEETCDVEVSHDLIRPGDERRS